MIDKVIKAAKQYWQGKLNGLTSYVQERTQINYNPEKDGRQCLGNEDGFC